LLQTDRQTGIDMLLDTNCTTVDSCFAFREGGRNFYFLRCVQADCSVTPRRRLSRYHVKAAATWSWPHTACSVGGKNAWSHTSVLPYAPTSSWRAQGPLELVFVNYWGRIISYFKLTLSHLVVYRVLAK